MPCFVLRRASNNIAPRYVEGQRVRLSTRDIPLKVDAPKMNPRFIGPYTIAKVINPSSVRLNLPATLRRIHPTFHVSRIKPFVQEALSSIPKAPSPPRMVGGSKVHTIR